MVIDTKYDIEVTIKVHKSLFLCNDYKLIVTAKLKTHNDLYTDEDLSIDDNAAHLYCIAPVAGVAFEICRIIASDQARDRSFTDIVLRGSSAAMVAESVVFVAHRAYQLYRHHSNEVYELISKMHGEFSRIFSCQAGRGEAQFSYTYSESDIEMQLRCVSHHSRTNTLLHDICTEMKREYKKWQDNVIEIRTENFIYDKDSEEIFYNKFSLSCKLDVQTTGEYLNYHEH